MYFCPNFCGNFCPNFCGIFVNKCHSWRWGRISRIKYISYTYQIISEAIDFRRCGEYRETYQVIFGDGITSGIGSELPLIRSYHAFHIVHISCSFGVLLGCLRGGLWVGFVSWAYRACIVSERWPLWYGAYRVRIVFVSDGVYRVCLWYVCLHILDCIRSVSYTYHIHIVWPSRVLWYISDIIR